MQDCPLPSQHFRCSMVPSQIPTLTLKPLRNHHKHPGYTEQLARHITSLLQL